MLLHKLCAWTKRQRRQEVDTKHHLQDQKDLCSNPGLSLETPNIPAPSCNSSVVLQASYYLLEYLLGKSSHCSLFSYKINIIIVSSSQKL